MTFSFSALVAAFFLGLFLGSFRRIPGTGVAPDAARLAPDALAAIDRALADGHRVQAIRLLRRASGCGLADAKMFVDQRISPDRRGDPIER